MTAWDERLVLVVGSARSGTTLLHHLLTAHPDTVGLPLGETWLFRSLWPLWENCHADPPAIAAWLPADAVLAASRAFCDEILSAARDRLAPAASWFVEKTPDHVYRLPLVRALYPGARVVHIIRDGRDVAQSLQEMPAGPSSVGEAAEMWRSAVSAARLEGAAFRWQREVRYEALVAEPVAVVKDLMEWLGLSVDDALAEELRRRSGEQVSPHPSGSPGRPGKHRRLGAAELADIETVAGALLAELGYLDPPPRR